MFTSSTLFFGIVLTFLVNVSLAGYTIRDDYNPSNFFSMFDFSSAPDPTHGFVQYVDKGIASDHGLVSSNDGSVYVGVDHKTVSSSGRASVRLESRNRYTRGLFVADIAHMPGGICGTWPALSWTFGPDWPNGGEIDIIEQIHQATNNHMTLHTGAKCSMNGGTGLGSLVGETCSAWENSNQGCGVSAHSSQSYGSDFNRGGGGAYAMEWTSQHIAVWFWPRGSIPDNALSSDPDPSQWGEATAFFQGDCDIDANFRDHKIILDTTFCGDWAGNVWGSSGCSAQAASCTDFVANNPSAFVDAYWEIKSLKVFQHG